MVVKIVPNDRSAPADKLADAEIFFEDGLLTGMKLVGFSIWRSQRRAIFTVTFPARQFMVNGERRSYALLRPITPGGSQESLRLCILQAYAEYEQRFGPGGSRSEVGGEAPPGENATGSSLAGDQGLSHESPRDPAGADEDVAANDDGVANEDGDRDTARVSDESTPIN
jgi:hypothetical protein